MQCFFQSEDNAPYSGESAHVFGTSTSNQRVQNWWIPNHLNYIHHRIFAEEWNQLFINFTSSYLEGWIYKPYIWAFSVFENTQQNCALNYSHKSKIVSFMVNKKISKNDWRPSWGFDLSWFSSEHVCKNITFLHLITVVKYDFQNTVKSLHIQKVRITLSMECRIELSVPREVHFLL